MSSKPSPPRPHRGIKDGSDGTYLAFGLLLACTLLIVVTFGLGDDPFAPEADRVVTAGPIDNSTNAAIAPQAAGNTPGRRFAQALVLEPRKIDGQIAGYTISSETGPAALMEATLRPGDILMDMDGRPLDPERLRTLSDELSVADSIEVTFERQGQLRKRLIDLRG